MKNGITIDLEDSEKEIVKVTYWTVQNLMPLLNCDSITQCYLELKTLLNNKVQITALKKEIKAPNGTITKYFNGLSLNQL